MSESLATVSYLGATILFILCLGGLSNQETARRGNLYGLIGMAGIFWLTGALAVGAIVLLFRAVPPAPSFGHAARVPLIEVLRDGRLLRLNFGIFVLHLNQMAMFVVLPRWLVERRGRPTPHPCFRAGPGPVASWERP